MMMRVALCAVAATALQLPVTMPPLPKWSTQLNVDSLPTPPQIKLPSLPDPTAVKLPEIQAPTLPQAPDGSVTDLATRLLSEAQHALQGDWTPYATVMAASCAATVALTLPALLLTGAAERKRQERTATQLPEEAEAPYKGGANDYSPAKAEQFYAKRPLLVAERLAWLTQATFAFNVKLLIDYLRGWPEASEPERAKECLALCEELGPTFIKLGQALSIRTDLISEAYALELRKLQDAVPPFPTDQALAILNREFASKGGVTGVFESISPEPVASASLGQVYRGKLRESGKEVAIKVQRPDILPSITLDMHILRILAPYIQKSKNLNSDLVGLLDQWGSRFVAELDYKREAENGKEFIEAMKARKITR